jgi:HipA-like protein
MRSAAVYRNGQLAGILTQHDPESYTFRYDDGWFANDNLPAVSLTLPKTRQSYHSDHLFPFFFNMLPEGANKELQCRLLKIDESDHFGLLVAAATQDTVGAITIRPIESE